MSAWPLPRPGAYSLSIKSYGSSPSDNRVTVDNALLSHPTLGEYRIYSSLRYVPGLVVEEWRTKLATTVAKRLSANHGADKGRVLYVTADRAPMAALAYHVPSRGPLEILDADAALWVLDESPDFASLLVATLFDCLLEISSHELFGRGRATLAWISESNDAANRAHEIWGFHGRPASRRPRHNNSRHYLTRQFADG